MNLIKKIIRKIVSYSEYSSDEYKEKLVKSGVQIGIGTYFFSPGNTVVDITRPFMIKIGEYVKITSGCIILAHDYSRSVLRRSYNCILGESKETIIGNNVFLGMNTIVLPGAKIGNNVIVGAGSVVSGRIPDNVVVAGNPAKVIQTLDEHYEKIKSNNLKNCVNHYKCFYERYNKAPKMSQMEHYFPIFCNSLDLLNKNDINLRWNGDDYQEIVTNVMNSGKKYESFESFIKNENLPSSK